jgi:ABC-type phosphate/phosphonate transport system substrate-binding protein
MQRRSFFALLPAALLSATVAAAAAEPVKFAVTDIEGLETLQREFGPFRELLSELTAVEIELFAVNSRTVAAEALRNEQVDFVLTGPPEYVVMRKLTNAEPVVAFSRPDYFSAIIVMADSRFQRPEDLKAQRVAFGDVGSTSNHLAPAQILADYGVTDIETIHTSTDIAHEALRTATSPRSVSTTGPGSSSGTAIPTCPPAPFGRSCAAATCPTMCSWPGRMSIPTPRKPSRPRSSSIRIG